MNSSRSRLNVKAAGIVGAAVLCSRVLGLAREMIFAGLFGAGRGMDAFLIAFKAPNLLRDLFAEGALSTAFITVFSKKIQTGGPYAAWPLAAKMATLVTVFMSGVTLLGIVFAPAVIGVLAPGFDAEKAALTVWLTRLMFPFILFVSLAALVMGMLNARDIFGVPAMASSFFNIGSIAGGVVFGWLLDPGFGTRALTGLAIGTLLGGLLQLGVQLPSLWRAGFRFVPDFRWRDEGVRQVLRLMLPSVIAASAVQVNVMINAMFASFMEDGAVSWLQFAFRLMQLPLGVFGVAIATVTLPAVSKLAAEGVPERFKETLSGALRLALFLTVPSAVGLAVLAGPIISLLYERGRFTVFETLRTAEALQAYALGLAAYSCIKVLAPAFYALERRWVPMLASFGSIGLNVALNYTLIFVLGMGHRGLALSTSLSALANFGVLYVVMRRQLGGLHTGAVAGALLRCGLAAGVMGAVVVWLDQLVAVSMPQEMRAGFVFKLARTVGLVWVGAGIYFLGARVLGVEEAQRMEKLMREQAGRFLRRLRGRQP